MHGVTGHNNIPKQAHEKRKWMFSHDWNRIVQAMDAFENKTDRQAQARATWGWETWMQMEKEDVLFE